MCPWHRPCAQGTWPQPPTGNGGSRVGRMFDALFRQTISRTGPAGHRRAGLAKVDVAIHQQGNHCRPSEVAEDVTRAATRSSCVGPGGGGVAKSRRTRPSTITELRTVCRLARLVTVPVLSIKAASAGSGLDAEVKRLAALDALAESRARPADRGHGSRHLHRPPRAQSCHVHLGLTLEPSRSSSGPTISQLRRHVVYSSASLTRSCRSS